MKKLVVSELRQMINPNNLINTIYDNFIYLKEQQNLMHNKQEIKRLLTDENMIGYMVYDGNYIIAYLIGETKHLTDGRIVYYISYMYVAPKYRKHKIGSYLLKKVILDTKNRGLKFILLTYDVSNNKLLNFYTKFGFHRDPILKNNQQHDIFTLYL